MKVLLVILVFILMEGATWLIHKYIMHGFLWFLHKDHHDHSNKGELEKNDWFFVIFSLPTIALVYFGSLDNFNELFFIGLGIMFYGMAYFFVHDIFIHQRMKFFSHTKNRYFWHFAEHTNNITNTWEKKKASVLGFYMCHSSISKCIINLIFDDKKNWHYRLRDCRTSKCCKDGGKKLRGPRV